MFFQTIQTNVNCKQSSSITTSDPVNIEPASESLYTGNRISIAFLVGASILVPLQGQGIIILRELEVRGQFKTIEIVWTKTIVPFCVTSVGLGII